MKKITKAQKTKATKAITNISLKHKLPKVDIKLHQDAVVTVKVNGRQISVNAGVTDLEEQLDKQITKFKNKKTTKKEGDKLQ